jgi:hypothetical protein
MNFRLRLTRLYLHRHRSTWHTCPTVLKEVVLCTVQYCIISNLHQSIPITSAPTMRADSGEVSVALLPKPERSATYHSSVYKHSNKLLLAHEIAAWQMDNEFIQSAYRCTPSGSNHSNICLTDTMAGQPLVPLANRLLACSKCTIKQ